VAAAIDTIAEVGYGQASLARIAQRVGISKGVIVYHFDSKEDLVKEVVAEVLSKARDYMVPRIGAASGGREKLRAYIESNIGFMAEYRNHMIAVVEIARGSRDTSHDRFGDGPVLIRRCASSSGRAVGESTAACAKGAGSLAWSAPGARSRTALAGGRPSFQSISVSPVRTGTIGAGRSWTAWMISALSIPRR
jgi:AcrR family transcriptional regulator